MKILYPLGYIPKSKNIENALSIHKMGFKTSSSAYITRGNVFMTNYWKIIVIILIFYIHAGDIWDNIQRCNIHLSCLHYRVRYKRTNFVFIAILIQKVLIYMGKSTELLTFDITIIKKK